MFSHIYITKEFFFFFLSVCTLDGFTVYFFFTFILLRLVICAVMNIPASVTRSFPFKDELLFIKFKNT